MAFRQEWLGSHIGICEITNTWECINKKSLAPDRYYKFGLEDPRLFVYNDQLCCSVVGRRQATVHGSHHWWEYRYEQGIYGLDDNLEVISEMWLQPRGTVMQPEQGEMGEKNWTFFEYDGKLYGQRHLYPYHEVYEIIKNKAWLRHTTPSEIQWQYGRPRGGTPPVLFGDKFVSVFHSSINREVPFKGIWLAGAYAFESKPPFRITHYTREPIMSPAMGCGSNLCNDNLAAVFPSGLIIDGNRWMVSYGFDDWESRVAIFNGHEIMAQLQPV